MNAAPVDGMHPVPVRLAPVEHPVGALTRTGWADAASDAVQAAARRWVSAVIRGDSTAARLRACLDAATHHARMARIAAAAGEAVTVVAAHAQAAAHAARAHRRVTCPPVTC